MGPNYETVVRSRGRRFSFIPELVARAFKSRTTCRENNWSLEQARNYTDRCFKVWAERSQLRQLDIYP